MTKKDFIVIAGVLERHCHPGGDAGGFTGADAGNVIAWDIADALQRDNPRFDRVRFLRACNAPAQDPAA